LQELAHAQMYSVLLSKVSTF